MCLPSFKDRRIAVLQIFAACCLLVSLGSQSLDITFGLSPSPVHFLRGLFLGIYIAIQFQLLRLIRRHRQAQSRQA